MSVVQELRLGNLVYKYNSFKPLDLSVFTVSELPFDNYKDGTNYKPIPLNAIWLYKFGFMLTDTDNRLSFYENDMGYCIAHSEGGGFEFLPCGKYNYSIDITTVHQLQNLYFMLADQELKCG